MSAQRQAERERLEELRQDMNRLRDDIEWLIDNGTDVGEMKRELERIYQRSQPSRSLFEI